MDHLGLNNVGGCVDDMCYLGRGGNCCRMSRGDKELDQGFEGGCMGNVDRGLRLLEARWALVSGMHKDFQKGICHLIAGTLQSIST